MIDDEFSHVIIQSLHTLPGVEYDWTVQQAQAMCHPRKGLTEIHIGTPLLHSMEDLEQTAKAVAEYIPSERKEKDGVILIGHGTYHNGHTFYPALEGLISRTLSNIVVGTLMDKEGPAQLGQHFLDKGITKIFLLPFMCVPGHHVQVDLFGKGPSSWKSILTSMGIDVIDVHTGSLAHDQFRQIWLAHLAEAVTANTAPADPHKHND
jgi:sirohydrochlorin cobaltochelatase